MARNPGKSEHRTTKPRKPNALLLTFKEDTITTVSRRTFSVVAQKLGFNETQAAHYAFARLRDEILRRPRTAAADAGEEEYPPLTAEQLLKIRETARKPRGKLVKRESLFK